MTPRSFVQSIPGGWLLAACLLTEPALASEAARSDFTAEAHLSSVVYGYGIRLEPPFRFTNIGGDTLYLNGLPYHPTADKLGHDYYDPYVDVARGQLTETDSGARLHEQDDRLAATKRAALADLRRQRNPKPTPEEKARAVGEQYRALDFVEYARISGASVEYKLRGRYPASITFVIEDPSSLAPVDEGPEENRRIHDGLTVGFTQIVEAPEAFFAFGSGYHLDCLRMAECARATRHLIDEVSVTKSTHVTAQQREGTLLVMGNFVAELLAAVHGIQH